MRRILKNQAAVMLATSLLLAAPGTASACSACMGRSGDAATLGLNAAVLTLLAVLLLVLGSVGGFLAYLIRRSLKHPLALPGMP